jgi:pimeloyl-ACP methyl ester carboxylesterase
VTESNVFLLPGLDGTADLFAPFVASAPAGLQLTPVPLAMSGAQSYRGLAEDLVQRLPSVPVHLIAESFSGPLAILLASKVCSVKSVILCATFATPPVPRALEHVPDWLLRRVPPTAFVAALMSGGDWKAAEALTRAVCCCCMPAATKSHRRRVVLESPA